MNDTPQTNDTLNPVPHIPHTTRRLEFDFPALEVGIAEYAEGPTGCTVFHFPNGGATVACDVRGGMPGVFMEGDGYTDAVCFAGGSLNGLEACTGVAAELWARRGYGLRMSLVRGAIIWDFGRRDNTVCPDKVLGRAALQAAKTGEFLMGRRGAGCSAGVGSGLGLQGESAGQGGAFRTVSATKIAVFCVVNALGCIVDRQGQVVRGNLDKTTGTRHHPRERLEQIAAEGADSAGHPTRNTTLTLLVTNQKLEQVYLTQLARQVHSSMARAIQPFHTPSDGDVLFAATTGEVENSKLSPQALGVLASELAWDAVLSSYEE
jgi:6-aminohexanoate-oligomer endohydrolase